MLSRRPRYHAPPPPSPPRARSVYMPSCWCATPGVPYEEVDGSDGATQEARNNLWTVSGHRGKYPQVRRVNGKARGPASEGVWNRSARVQSVLYVKKRGWFRNPNVSLLLPPNPNPQPIQITKLTYPPEGYWVWRGGRARFRLKYPRV